MNKLPDNFAGYPPSITEMRANAAQSMMLWTPRDALLSLLREIDEGKVKVDVLVVAFAQVDADGTTRTNFRAAAPNALMAFGVMTRAMQMMGDPD